MALNTTERYGNTTNTTDTSGSEDVQLAGVSPFFRSFLFCFQLSSGGWQQMFQFLVVFLATNSFIYE